MDEAQKDRLPHRLPSATVFLHSGAQLKHKVHRGTLRDYVVWGAAALLAIGPTAGRRRGCTGGGERERSSGGRGSSRSSAQETIACDVTLCANICVVDLETGTKQGSSVGELECRLFIACEATTSFII